MDEEFEGYVTATPYTHVYYPESAPSRLQLATFNQSLDAWARCCLDTTGGNDVDKVHVTDILKEALHFQQRLPQLAALKLINEA